MKKITVIIGDRSSGKSLTAEQIVKEKGLKTVHLLAEKVRRNSELEWFFNSCDTDTEMIVIHEVQQNFFIDFIFLVQNCVWVHKKYKKPFMIHPKEVVFTCSEKITKEIIEACGSSIIRRVEIIECTKETLANQLQSL